MRFVRPILPIALAISLAANVFMYLKWRNTRPVITVDGQAITQRDVVDYLEREQGPVVKAQLTARALIDQAARKAHLVPSDAEIERVFQTKRDENPQFAEQLMIDPWQEQFDKDVIKEELEQERLRAASVKVTPQDIEAGYQAHPAVYDVPNKAVCEVAEVLDPMRKAEIEQLLQRGVSASDILANYPGSVRFPGWQNQITFVQPLGTRVNQVIFSMRPGQVKEFPSVPSTDIPSSPDVAAVLLRLQSVEPGHKYTPGNPADSYITDNIRLAVASKSMMPLQQWLRLAWQSASFSAEDPNDKRYIELQLFPAIGQAAAKE